MYQINIISQLSGFTKADPKNPIEKIAAIIEKPKDYPYQPRNPQMKQLLFYECPGGIPLVGNQREISCNKKQIGHQKNIKKNTRGS